MSSPIIALNQLRYIREKCIQTEDNFKVVMARKAMDQVPGIQCNTLLHPHFTLMCNSTTHKFNFISSWIPLIVVELSTN